LTNTLGQFVARSLIPDQNHLFSAIASYPPVKPLKYAAKRSGESRYHCLRLELQPEVTESGSQQLYRQQVYLQALLSRFITA